MTTNLTALYGLGGTAGGGCKWKSQTFTVSGIWQKPEGVEMVRVLLVGGGGGGSSGSGAGDGGNSTFTASPFTIAAKGGFAGGGAASGGNGGGSEQDYFFTSAGLGRYGHVEVGYFNLFARLFGNGAKIINTGSNFQWIKAFSGISKGNSITGGGGGIYYNYEPYYVVETVVTPGGSVSGFGTGGSSTQGVGAGGGASFGDGVSALNPNTGGYGGGGAGPTFGGGGGEIVIREIPVSGPATVIIGSGGAGSPARYGVAEGLPGKSGLCIVSWIE